MIRPVSFFQAGLPFRVDRLQPVVIVNWSVGAMTAIVGSIGVVHNTWPNAFRGPEFRLPLAFGTGLAAFIALRFHWHLRSNAPLPDSSAALTRRLSRLVYLTLYVLVGANQACAVLNNQALPTSATGLQGYLIAGVVSLALIRVLRLTAKLVRVQFPRDPAWSTDPQGASQDPVAPRPGPYRR